MKRLQVLFVLLLIVFFSFTVVAQEIGSIRKSVEYLFSEKIQSPLGPPLAAGTYSIGTGGYFPTIDSAFNKLSIDGIAGEIVLELIDELYIAPTTQYGFLLNGPIPGSSSRVTIKPAVNKNVTIEGGNYGVLCFLNTSNVTIDGIGLTGPTTLTIHTLQNTAYSWNDGIIFFDNSDHNIVQNVGFICEDYIRVGSGIGMYTQVGSNATADNNLILNNFIKKAGIAIYLSAYESNTKAVGNIVRGNKVGSETDSLITWGIQLEMNQDAIVENNLVENLKVYNSYITGNMNIGINSFKGTGCIIRKNVVHNIKSSGGILSVGILLSGDVGATGYSNQIYNNMIYDIQSTSTNSQSNVAGIQMWYQNDPKIYYNSVYLLGNGANPLGSAALYIDAQCTNVDAKNNILVNTRNESPYCASSIRAVSGFSTFTTDYNDLYYEPNQYNCLVKFGSDYHTLADWQATGKDFHSASVLPCFSSLDLHIDVNMATCLEKRGTPIAGFNTDFDGDIRNVNLPDIGADEFAGMIPTGALSFGAYSVGTTGFFPSIESVFNRLSSDGVAGPVTLELTDNLYTAPTTQYGFSLNGPIPGAGPNSRVTIKPAVNKNVIIEGNGRYVVSFLNTSYSTIDGIGLTGATTLTIHTLYNSQFQSNCGVYFFNNSDHNVIQNVTFISEDYTREGESIGFFTQSGFTTTADSNLIENNFIKKANCAIFIGSLNPSVKAIGNIIRGNLIGSETDSLINWGIQSQYTQNTIIENNIVQNVRYLNNYFSVGINSYVSNGDIIRNNVVHNIYANNGIYGGIGIMLSGDPGEIGSNSLVYNNMVYDIRSSSNQSGSIVAGIQVWYQNNPKIYYNSVYLSGNGNGANPNGSAALYISSEVTNLEAKNNILVNARDESPYCASAIYDYSASNLTSDYNNLYNEANTNNCLVRIGSIKYSTLPEWRAMGKDLNSLNEIVNFISPTDLHINHNYFTKLDGYATPIAGIDTDFDGQPRNSLLPDIGADEFDPSVNASNWQMQNSGFPSNVMVVDFSTVNNQVCWAVGQVYPQEITPYAGYIRTTDGGNNWVCDTIPGITNGFSQQIFAIDANTAYVTCYKLGTTGNVGVFKTTDEGVTWNRQNAFNTSLYGPGYIHFFDALNGVVIGDPNLETYTTTNGGLTWNPVSMPPALTDEVTWLNGTSINAVGNTIWFGTGARLFKSTDKGYTWTILISEPQYIRWSPSIAFQDSQNGIYSLKKQGDASDHLYRKTTDGGFTWNTISNSILDNIAPTSLQHIPGTEATYIVSGGRNPGMNGTTITTDAGTTWSLIDNVGKLYIVFPSTTVGWGSQRESNVVQKYVGPNTPVEEEQIDEVPTVYMLSQNYPNPFNPSTTLRYSIPNESKVTIKVYDIIGREVVTLVNGEKATGTYELTWNAANLPSGVYLYQLNAGEYTSVKKMILLK